VRSLMMGRTESGAIELFLRERALRNRNRGRRPRPSACRPRPCRSDERGRCGARLCLRTLASASCTMRTTLDRGRGRADEWTRRSTRSVRRCRCRGGIARRRRRGRRAADGCRRAPPGRSVCISSRTPRISARRSFLHVRECRGEWNVVIVDVSCAAPAVSSRCRTAPGWCRSCSSRRDTRTLGGARLRAEASQQHDIGQRERDLGGERFEEVQSPFDRAGTARFVQEDPAAPLLAEAKVRAPSSGDRTREEGPPAAAPSLERR
jgi:hypothetical protein